MTHRIKPGARYKLDPNGPIYENTLPHDIIVDRTPIFVGGRIEPRFHAFGPSNLLDAVILNGICGKASLRDIVAAWPSPKKDSPFPAFVVPERLNRKRRSPSLTRRPSPR